MNTLLIMVTLLICGTAIFLKPNEAPGALACCAAVSIPTIIILARNHDDRNFLVRLFLLGVLVRIIIAFIIYSGHMEEFFGGDANTYDVFGQSLAASWHGDQYHTMKYNSFVASGASAWGMIYVVAIVYEILGNPNVLAVQLVNAAVGSATAIVVYYV